MSSSKSTDKLEIIEQIIQSLDLNKVYEIKLTWEVLECGIDGENEKIAVPNLEVYFIGK